MGFFVSLPSYSLSCASVSFSGSTSCAHKARERPYLSATWLVHGVQHIWGVMQGFTLWHQAAMHHRCVFHACRLSGLWMSHLTCDMRQEGGGFEQCSRVQSTVPCQKMASPSAAQVPDMPPEHWAKMAAGPKGSV